MVAKKKMSNQSKQPLQSQCLDSNNKLQSLNNLYFLLIKETSQRRLQVQSLQSHLSNTSDDNVVSELQKYAAFAFVMSQVADMGFHFATYKNDMERVVSQMKEKLLEGEKREGKVLEELRKVKSEGEELMEEGFRKERVIGEVMAERDSAVRDMRELKEKVLEAENREKKLLDKLRKMRLQREKLRKEGFEKERVIVEVREQRDSAVRNSRELKEKLLEAENGKRKLLEELQKVRLEGEKLIEEGCLKERVIGEVTVERDSALRNMRELKEKVLEAENREKKLLDKLRRMRLQREKLRKEGFEKERVIVEVREQRDSVVRKSRELKEKLLEELQKVRLEGEKLIEEGCRKERVIGEVTVERDSALRNLRESETVIEKFKGEMDLVMREKDGISKLNDAQKVKITSMELELVHVNEALNDVCKEENLMRGKILELEEEVGIYVEKEEGLMLEIRDLVKQKEEMKGSVEMLKERRDSVEKVLDEVRKELEDKQCEIEKAKVSYMEEIIEARDIANELNQSCKGFEKKNRELLSEVESYRNAVKEIMVERDNIRKGFDVKKNRVKTLMHMRNAFDKEQNKVKSLALQVAKMEGKIEAMAGEIDMMSSEKVKLLEKNEMVESRVSVLMNEKDALQQSLLEAQQECDEVRAKVEFHCLNSNRVLEMLKSAAALICQDEEVVSIEQKPEEEIQLFDEQLGAIRDAFRNNEATI